MEEKKPKEKEESTQDKIKKALDALKSKVKNDDDRPTPKEDNFATTDAQQPVGVLSDTQILALQASTIYSAYIQTIREAVTGNFIWYKTGANFSTRVMMKVDPKGSILNTTIEKSSGDPAYDQAVLRAIQKSNPLPPPPDELVALFIQESVEINFERKEP